MTLPCSSTSCGSPLPAVSGVLFCARHEAMPQDAAFCPGKSLPTSWSFTALMPERHPCIPDAPGQLEPILASEVHSNAPSSRKCIPSPLLTSSSFLELPALLSSSRPPAYEPTTLSRTGSIKGEMVPSEAKSQKMLWLPPCSLWHHFPWGLEEGELAAML